MTDRFKRAYDALCKSFFEGTLAKGTCVACAVGNIVADARGEKVILPTDIHQNSEISSKIFPWNELRRARKATDPPKRTFIPKEEVLLSERQKENDIYLTNLTGYSNNERCLIEDAFEGNTEIQFDRYYGHSESEILNDQYNGLCAAFKVMCELDEVSVNYEQKLRQHPKLVHI